MRWVGGGTPLGQPGGLSGSRGTGVGSARFWSACGASGGSREPLWHAYGRVKPLPGEVCCRDVGGGVGVPGRVAGGVEVEGVGSE